MTASEPRPPIVALDGPAGAGKSTVAALLAERLGFVLVDTGALYRGIALAAKEAGLVFSDGVGIGQLLEHISISLEYDAPTRARLMLNGHDRTSEIRTPEISSGASQVSALPQVRDYLLELQRSFGRSGGVVMEGRDIGTVVFPDAEIKIFLTATPEVRAQRRLEQLASKGEIATLDDVLASIEARDRRDSGRPVSPLRQADDAIEVDTSAMSMEQVVDTLTELVDAANPLKNKRP